MTLLLIAGAILTGLDPTFIALVGTLMGGVGLKIAEHWLNRNRVRVDDARTIRDELRQEIDALRVENRELEVDRDNWREKYYALYERLMEIKASYRNE